MRRKTARVASEAVIAENALEGCVHIEVVQRLIVALAVLGCVLLGGCAGEGQASLAASDLSQSAVYEDAKSAAANALANRLDGMRECVYVYRDYGDSENHFTQRSRMAGKYPEAIRAMDEDCGDNPHSGSSCIRCSQNVSMRDWGGWMFLNGYVPEGKTEPVINDSAAIGAGMDLTGAVELRFWARGEKGGEIVDFFTLGFDWTSGQLVHPKSTAADSNASINLRNVRLEKEWKEYSIPLDGADLTCIANGFGYAMDDSENHHLYLDSKTPGGEDAVFYLDDIRFVGTVESAQAAPMMMRSYDTGTVEIANAAFTYDNALAAMAFLSEGMNRQAEELLDALCYAVENDRYKPGRIRNAYASGDISPAPGWGSGAKLPGWYDAQAGAWYEDSYQVGANVGNTSYAALALLHYAAKSQGDQAGDFDAERSKRYLSCAQKLMDWVNDECSDGRDGFTAGYEGWPENGPSGATALTYKSTEHNIDAYAAFAELFKLTGDARYEQASESARRFVESMYDADAGLFLTGTKSDGITPEKGNVVLDAQVWSALALGEGFEPYGQALSQLDAMRTDEGGYRFHVCDDKGYWCEGTAFTALMHLQRGERDKASAALGALEAVQLEGGLLPAATIPGLTTGIDLSDGTPWTYNTDPHVAPTAWYVMACNGFNPYTF